MAHSVLLIDHSAGAFGVGLGENVFTYYSRNVTSIARDVLQLHLVSGATYPILRILTPVTIYITTSFGLALRSKIV
jgi:hypothetical protein